MTIRRNIYGEVLEEVEIMTPDRNELKRLTEVIMNTLAGEKKEKDRDFLIKRIRDFRKRGAEKVILGCMTYLSYQRIRNTL